MGHSFVKFQKEFIGVLLLEKIFEQRRFEAVS